MPAPERRARTPASFAWRVAVPAVKEGFRPDVISTDMHVASMSGGMKDMSNVMSKFLALGMPLDEVIRRLVGREVAGDCRKR